VAARWRSMGRDMLGELGGKNKERGGRVRCRFGEGGRGREPRLSLSRGDRRLTRARAEISQSSPSFASVPRTLSALADPSIPRERISTQLIRTLQ